MLGKETTMEEISQLDSVVLEEFDSPAGSWIIS